jgi:ER lumen protein retaining receptor
MTAFNVFRILADVSHTSSKIILIWAIHSNSSAEGRVCFHVCHKTRLTRSTGVSLITQALYALVFCTRYLDIFTSSATGDGLHIWNFTLKVCLLKSANAKPC